MIPFKVDIHEAADFLDSEVPNWSEQIDTEKLNMLEARRCILGQLYGDYTTGLLALGLSPNHYAFGPMAPKSHWTEEIGRRQRKMELTLGKTYLVATPLVYTGNGARHEFANPNGMGVLLLDKETTTITDIPYEVRSGDVYRKDGRVYEVVMDRAYETGNSTSYPVSQMGFREDERIYRKDSDE